MVFEVGSATCTKPPSALHVAQFQSFAAITMVNPFLWLILNLLNLYFYVILASVIMSWLIGFNVINGANPYVRQIVFALRRLTEPLLGPIRRFLPDLGGLDISPIILLLALQFVQYLIVYYAPRFL
jgi:YggT family protein